MESSDRAHRDRTKIKILWFGDIGRRNSFSRISESILPILRNHFEIILLAPPKQQILDFPESLNGLEIINIGDPIGDQGNELKWDDFKFMIPGVQLPQLRMKYSLLQAGFLCDKHKIDYIVFLGGNFVVEWFLRLINIQRSCIPSKIIVWTPFDYIPSTEALIESKKADITITMNPIVQELVGFKHWIGHGISSSFKQLSRNRCIKEVKNIVDKGVKLDKTDTIILNANNFIDRKRIGVSLDAFKMALKKYPNIKFWLHTKTDCLEFKVFIAKYLDLLSNNQLIVTNNNVNDTQLNYIYNCCDIGLQTSSGEGWSLTNCEHQQTGAIQVVPDFLATKFNFSETGILIPTEITDSKDESENDIKVGIVTILETTRALIRALDLVTSKKFERLKVNLDISWESEANKFKELIIN